LAAGKIDFFECHQYYLDEHIIDNLGRLVVKMLRRKPYEGKMMKSAGVYVRWNLSVNARRSIVEGRYSDQAAS
jgi:hypothetical protein